LARVRYAATETVDPNGSAFGVLLLVLFTPVPFERKLPEHSVPTSAPETDYSSASYAPTVASINFGGSAESTGPIFLGVPWIADLAIPICEIAGFKYLIVFTSFPLRLKITGALFAANAPATDYSSASYALTVVINFGGSAESTGDACFGCPWIADLAGAIKVIAAFV
jgi:hypothetical protein